ncbi:hypothetical protein G3N56_03130 [Desulfovibrio sulfodismutans]|uniref:Uncharacterized protein n=1 Tax=Desulfolutivibrio sulfodismutans TaxID=63561 RepID=A0A7K3NIX4_9BACT|nr:hypothetical protein [Desulfolutivibrio sulfodismutans]NDY55735.1 hypothetical protein [Desulfolutivibrio sulfodismutans]QLA13754.1 hypothetical protein GD606_16560 [Desulfolutivibrio sulfodismutans DSM 3696]
MATRPIFIVNLKDEKIITHNIHFKWHPGYSIAQKQKSISDLHNNAHQLGIENILEVSSKSPNKLGTFLSAFNLKSVTVKNNIEFSVESAFQGSKVFSQGGPFADLITKDSRSAKKDPRIRQSGELLCFKFFSFTFPLTPKTYFYDWLYINTLLKNEQLASEAVKFSAFTDIEFNPEKSVNCQAFSLALFVLLSKANKISSNSLPPNDFINICRNIYATSSSIVQDSQNYLSNNKNNNYQYQLKPSSCITMHESPPK